MGQVNSGDHIPALELVGLFKSFGKRRVVNGVHLKVMPGQVYGFLGPNGAGKTTTIRMIFGLVKPESGLVRIFGERLTPSNRRILADTAGLIEEPDFYGYLSARKNLEILGRLQSGVKREIIDESLDRVDLLDRADDKVKTYSHGMKQRLGIAQALMTRPRLMVLDEPTNGLDPQGMKDVRELIARLAMEEGIAVFLSSHLLHEVEQVATHVGVLNKGEMIKEGKVEELLSGAEQMICFKVSDPEAAVEKTSVLPTVTGAEIRDGILELNTSQEEVPMINKVLVDSGIDVYSISIRTPLEQYFLSITEGASDA